MRKPFIVAIHTNRPLTDLQSRRRGRLIEKSKCYREFLKRLRRKANRRGDQWHRLPLKNGLFQLLYPPHHPMFAEGQKAFASFESSEGIPHEQMMLELEVWQHTRHW